MEKAPNKINSEQSNIEENDGWADWRDFDRQVKAYREAKANARFDELLKEREEKLSWKDTPASSDEEKHLDDLLKQHIDNIESAPQEPVDFEPIPEDDAKLLLDNESEEPKEPEVPEEPENPEPIPEDDIKLLLDNKPKEDLPPAAELEKARKHQEIELSSQRHQEIEQASRMPLMAINAVNKANAQAIKQENLVPADQKLTEDVEYAIKKYAEYKVWLDGRKSTIDDQFKRDMKKIVEKAIKEGRVSPDIEKTDYLDNYLNTAKEAATQFIDVQKEVKNGKERDAALDNIMKGFKVYDVKESTPVSQTTLKSPARIITMSPNASEESSTPLEESVEAPEKANDFETWNENIIEKINTSKDLIGGYEGVAILTDPSQLSPVTSRHYREWWSNLPEKGKSAVLNIIEEIESSDYRHSLTWGNGFLAWYYSRANRTDELEAA